MARGKARDLDVVAHQPIGLRQRVIFGAEELLLVVVGRTPDQHGRDVERLARDLRPHVLGPHAFGRVLVVRAARRVNVMIARVPAVARGIDPPLQPERKLLRTGDVDAPRLRHDTRARATVTVNLPEGRPIVSPSAR